MRILHVINTVNAGGAEVFVKNLALAMQSLGHELIIVYVSESADLEVSEEFGERFKQELTAAGVSIHYLGHECRRNPVLGAVRLRRIIAEHQPDLVHVHLYYGILFFMLARLRQPLIYTHHNIRLGWGRRFLRLFDTVIDRYVGICDACVNALEPLITKPIRRIYNGIPTSVFRAPDRTARVSEPVRFVMVGRLSYQKHHMAMVSALVSLEDDAAVSGRWICEFVGEGPEEVALRAKIRECGLDDRILLVGNQQDVAARLVAADVFAMTSRYEGFPIALLEAVGTGLPAVVTDVGGCGEIVGRDPDVLVPEGDHVALVAGLRKMIVDSEHRLAVGVKNLEASARFDLECSVRDHLELYQTVIASRSDDTRTRRAAQ